MAGPSSLMAMAEDEVLEGLFYNYKRLESPFCVGGSLGRIPVRLAVAAPEGGGAAQTLELPGGGQDAVEALLQACEPAVFGKGKETGGWVGWRSVQHGPGGAAIGWSVPPQLLLPGGTHLHFKLRAPSDDPPCITAICLQCGTTRTAAPWP